VLCVLECVVCVVCVERCVCLVCVAMCREVRWCWLCWNESRGAFVLFALEYMERCVVVCVEVC